MGLGPKSSDLLLTFLATQLLLLQIHSGTKLQGTLAPSSAITQFYTQGNSSCSVAKPCLTATPWTAAHQASLSFTASLSLLRFMSIEPMMLSNHLILCCPLLFLPSIFPSIRVFSSVLALYIRGPKYWSFSFSIHPSNEYSGLISFRIDWFDLLAVQGILKSLLYYYS